MYTWRYQKKCHFFPYKDSFFLRASTFSQNWVFFQGILNQEPFLSEVDRHSRFLFVCLPACLFLSWLRIALRIRHMQDKYFTIEQHPHPYFLFLLWSQGLTDLPRLALTSLCSTNQPPTWEPPQWLGRAWTAVPGSQRSWLWGTNRRKMLFLTAFDTWRTCVQGGDAPKTRDGMTLYAEDIPPAFKHGTELCLEYRNVIFLLCVFCVYFYYCSTTIWQITYLIRASEMKRYTAIFTGSVWG